MYASGIQIQPTRMKVDRCLISFTVSETTRSILQTLDRAVNAFCTSIVGLKNNSVDDAPQMRFNRSGHFLDGF